MKKQKIAYLLLVSLLISSIFSILIERTVAFPNDLSLNDPDIEKVLDTNINSTLNAEFSGIGNYSSSSKENLLIDSKILHNNLLPAYNYGSATISVMPEYKYHTTNLCTDNYIQYNPKFDLYMNITEIDNNTYSYFSDAILNVSQVEYQTSFDDFFNVIGANASVPSQNPYPFVTFNYLDLGMVNPISMPTYDPSYMAFEDKDYQHYSAWAEARAWNFSHPDAYPVGEEFKYYALNPPYHIPSVNVSVEIAVEIINDKMGTTGELDYQEYWDLVEHYYRLTLEAISDPRLPIPPSMGNEIVIAENMTWEASLMYRDNGVNKPFIFNIYNERKGDLGYDGVIRTTDILNSPDRINPFTSYPVDPPSLSHWDYDNRTIRQADIDMSEGKPINESLFNDYGLWKGYRSNYGNPIIVFNFTATGLGFNKNWFGNEYGFWGYYTGIPPFPLVDKCVEDFYRAGGVDPTGITVPPNMFGMDTCWAKIKITEFDSKHKFKWEQSQNQGNSRFNTAGDVFFSVFDESSSYPFPNNFKNFYIDTSGYDHFLEGWDERIPLGLYNICGIIADNHLAYEWMNITFDLDIKGYIKDSTTNSELYIDNTKFVKNIYNWTLVTDNLSIQTYYRKYPSFCDSICFNLGTDLWLYEGYIYRYQIDFQEIMYRKTLSYINSVGTYNFSVDDSFSRDINITWNKLELFGNYIIKIQVNSTSLTYLTFFMAYTSDDIPIWHLITTQMDGFIYYWIAGYSKYKINLKYWLKDYVPSIQNYTIVSEIPVGTEREFNLTMENLDAPALDSAIIFEDLNTLERIAISLVLKSKFPNVYAINISSANISYGLYKCWYLVQDYGGNFNTTQSFNCDIKSDLPYPFILESDADSPDTDGKFNIYWTISINANNYSIILNSDIHKEGISELNYLLTLANGVYNISILAINDFGNITSNSLLISVIIEAISDDDDDGKKEAEEDINDLLNRMYLLIILIGIGVSIGVIIILANRKDISERWAKFKQQ